MQKTIRPVLIGGDWQPSRGTSSFQAVNPATRKPIGDFFAVSPWPEIEQALDAAEAAAVEMRSVPPIRIGEYLCWYADLIDARASALAAMANLETGLPAEARFMKNELPRTSNQLRQAGEAAKNGSWTHPTIDRKNRIRSMLGPIGPVVVFGVINFPGAFGAASGGDYAAAIAAGCPVIAKGNPHHPNLTQMFAEAALEAAKATRMPKACLQLLYDIDHQDGLRLVADRRIGASAFTGSRDSGLRLKKAADRAGKPIYLEMSSVNPVVITPKALAGARLEEIAIEYMSSCVMGTGQLCTYGHLVLMLEGAQTEEFIRVMKEKFAAAPAGTLLSEGILRDLQTGVLTLQQCGATLLTGGREIPGDAYAFESTLLQVDGTTFLAQPGLQEEVFGRVSLVVVAKDESQLLAIIRSLEGNLTGAIYSDQNGEEEDLYLKLESALRPRVGRLLNDKMPTGVAVSAAMQHGGPFPASGHPGFTAVGIPASLERFGMLQCFDNVPEHRLPPYLQDKAPHRGLWRSVDGAWMQGDLV
ncbi:MAG: NADP-dependent aldehyde dehydrogenase [Candidatus Peregrinibacteria bacterium Greene0416_62]|nr:MAG: NADP-dependent aldehyde dehydrogenase [Candidatus Peregrinibacteria bacterium Greene0416_62]TSC97811.1 MAG: NADP-dependent aldehyde dehydrogenase [Candidatus Peregrinibacteria bacterium Greene1014_49]